MPAARSTSTIRRELFRIARLAAGRRAFGRLTRASGVDLSQQEVQVMLALDHRGPLSVGGIARTAHMEKAAVSRNVSRLRAAELVITSTDARKGSMLSVALSDAGRRLARRIGRAQDDYLGLVLSRWSDEELSTLGGMLHRLADDLESQLDDPAAATR